MADCRTPEQIQQSADHDLPTDQPVGPQQARLRMRNRTALKVGSNELAAGSPSRDVLPEMRSSAETARTRLITRQQAEIRDRIQLDLLRMHRCDGNGKSAEGGVVA